MPTQADLLQHPRLAAHESAASLEKYLCHVVIDSRPDPQAWITRIEPWQTRLVKAMIPALEQIAGLRSGYTGPKRFLFVLPRGHDKTGLIGRLANWLIGFSRRPLEIAVAASARDQARLTAKSMRAEILLNSWLASRIEPYRNELSGPGGTLTVLSSDAPTASGRKDDVVILDELTFWEDRELFDLLYGGSAKREDSVFIIITNAGIRSTWQHELYEQWKSDPDWYVYESPQGKQLASWMDANAIDQIRKTIRPGFARRVIDNVWIDATETPLLSESLIRSCINRKCLKERGTGPIYFGGDFGRTQDNSAFVTLQKGQQKRSVRDLEVWSNTSFSEQESHLESKFKTIKPTAAYLDKGAQGWTTVENLERKFRGVVKGFHLGSTIQAEMALALKKAFEDRIIEIPDDEQLIRDLQLVEEVETANGKPRIVTNRESEIGHADRFWALALANWAAECEKPKSNVVPQAYVCRG